ncbi:hypothetical protein N752_19060 [Desulforamulus aquiferis]|nr:hypothetical protein N752_19060 [Desulforamulus aquiferis]
MLTTRPRGTNDILPGEVEKWQYLEGLARQVCREYGYGELRTPIFEHTELFHRGVGETTDVVEKEMYTFTDRGERSITLRPRRQLPPCGLIWKTNLAPFHNQLSCFISDRCSGMIVPRRDDSVSFTSLG